MKESFTLYSPFKARRGNVVNVRGVDIFNLYNMIFFAAKMLHISTKMLGLPPKITKMLDNAHHTEAFSYFFQREKKNRITEK